MSREKKRKDGRGDVFIENVNDLDREQFKAACALQGETMRVAHIKLMRLYVRRTNQGRSITE